MTIKNDLLFSYGPYTWQETYYDLSSSVIGQVGGSIARSRDLGNARAKIMGGGVEIAAVRQSSALYPPTPAASKRNTYFVYLSGDSTSAWTGPKEFQSTDPKTQVQGDNPTLSAKVRFVFSGGGFAIKYLAGCPDINQDGPNDFVTSNSVLSRYWAQWSAFITANNWGIRTRDFSGVTRPNILTMTQQGTSDQWNCTLGGTGIPTSPLPYYVQTRGCNGIPSFRLLNRIWKVGPNSTATNVTLNNNVRAPNAFIFLPSGSTLEPVKYTITPIFDVRVSYTTHRKRGSRGALSQRGKGARVAP